MGHLCVCVCVCVTPAMEQSGQNTDRRISQLTNRWFFNPTNIFGCRYRLAYNFSHVQHVQQRQQAGDGLHIASLVEGSHSLETHKKFEVQV